MKLIVGLGNPGAGYRDTRHNIGFVVMDALAERLSVGFDREKFQAQIAEARVGRDKVLLMKPLTYMNKSGESAAAAARNKVNDPADVLVIYDDVELPLGRLRIRKGGSPGTHNGMKSMVERLGTRDIPRLRIGVGQEKRDAGLADYVLAKFKPEEKPAVADAVDRAVAATLLWLEEGIEAAMNSHNQTAKAERKRRAQENAGDEPAGTGT